MTSSSETLLKFLPFASVIDTGFWHTLATNKLDSFRLDNTPKPITAHYKNDLSPNLRPLLNVDYQSFDASDAATKESHRMSGQLIVTNTYEEFVHKDKQQLINDLGKQIWQQITDGTAAEDPTQALSKFLLLVYADIKKFKFHYWFAFPVICFPPKSFLANGSPKVLSDVWSEDMINQLYSDIGHKFGDRLNSYFLVSVGDHISVHSIREYSSLKDRPNAKTYFAFSDPSSSTEYPGWPLRNYLAFIAHTFQLNQCSVLAVRLRDRSAKHSLLLDIEWQSSPEPGLDAIECVGWEKNEKNKLGPCVVDLSALLDPTRLAENAVDLNLKLMRWRLVPSLDLDTICATRCLLLGAGTLGCYVARALMAWGIKNLTLVDNSQVSYSNPVRQSLFKFDDCLDGGRPKAEAAAQALKQIFPNVNARGVQLSIPMPGHPVAQHLKDKVAEDVESLSQLIDQNDVVFLLMDTRESRWLPTVLCAAKNKLVINAALGFDTFLVQRHGVRGGVSSVSGDEPEGAVGGEAPSCSGSRRIRKVKGSQLGCYFCGDVVAPGNSTRDRTLDQQCTVTRPGVSMLASGLAVELMVSVLQHPLRGEAPALVVNVDESDDIDCETALGLVPHQIRGFLSRFQQLMPTSERFDKCSACSQPIIDSYNENGFEFLFQCFNDCDYIEELTGLRQLHNDTDLQEVWALSDDE